MLDKTKNPKQPKRRERFKLPLHVYLTYLIVITFIFTGVTFSKYVASTTASDGARVATFGELKLYEVAKDKDGDKIIEEGEKQQYHIAPGVPLYKEAIVKFSYDENENEIIDASEKSEMAAYIFITVDAPAWEFDNVTNRYYLSITHPDKTIDALSWNINIGNSDTGKKGWIKLGGEDSVYYQEVAPNTTFEDNIISDNEIKVSSEIYANDLNAISTATLKIGFQAYAVQMHGFNSATEAWASLSGK